MKANRTSLNLLAAVSVLIGSAPALATDRVNVAYFLEWATPNQIAKVERAFDDAMGVEVTWTNFGNGGAMTEAMLAGDIDIAYSQGLTPFANAVNASAPIKMVGIAVAYGAADDCIVRDDTGIGKRNAAELEGRTVAVPLNTMADFGFRMTLQTLGVDVNAVTIVDQDPADAAVSLVDGSVVMACGFGENSLAAMRDVGQPLLTAEEKAAAGITSFDIISVTESFLQDNPDLVRTFLEVTHEANAAFAADDSNIDVIAADAGMTVERTRTQMAGFAFPSVEDQLDDYFSDNGLALSMLSFMGKMFATEQHPALDDYSVTIDTGYLR
ncbi:MAG: ABC transporter substrate-binding protein [Pseudomonadota bacterium]